eukprot:7524492-Ditylum_brightwellii.AAC.1
MLIDHFVNLVFEECVDILDLFGTYVVLLGTPFDTLNKTDLPQPLFFCDMVSGMNVLPASLVDVAFSHVM